MAIDLTGIINDNEFYTHHYLSAILENDIKDVFSEWKRREQEDGIKPPYTELRNLHKDCFAMQSRLERERRPAQRLQEQELFLERLLVVLGYEYSPQYESDTWYDRNGRIVFTNSKGLVGVGFSRPEWNEIKDMESGDVERNIIDDTHPGGPQERTITYMAPFDRCNREKDYEEVWANYEKRF